MSASGFDGTNKTRTWRHKNSPTWNAEIKNCSYQARNNYSGNADRIRKTHFEVIFHSSSVPQPLWPFWIFNNKPLPSAADLELLSGLWVLSLSLLWCCFPRWPKELEVGRFLWVALAANEGGWAVSIYCTCCSCEDRGLVWSEVRWAAGIVMCTITCKTQSRLQVRFINLMIGKQHLIICSQSTF